MRQKNAIVLDEKFSWLSPYLYCANNPVNLIDKDGRDIWFVGQQGKVQGTMTCEQMDMMIIVENEKIKCAKVFDYGTVKSHETKKAKYNEKNKDKPYEEFVIVDDEKGTEVFEFLAENTVVEWSQFKTDGKDGPDNYVSTSYCVDTDFSGNEVFLAHFREFSIREAIHNHPSNTAKPSGIDFDPDRPGDVQFAAWIDKYNIGQAIYKIYLPGQRRYIEYDSYSTMADFAK